LGKRHADAAKTANDDVIAELVDLGLHAPYANSCRN
jgi:hypothetical protein